IENKRDIQKTSSIQVRAKKTIGFYQYKKDSSEDTIEKSNNEFTSQKIFSPNKNVNHVINEKDTVRLFLPLLTDTSNSKTNQSINDKTGETKEVTDSSFNALAQEQKKLIVLTDTAKQLVTDTAFAKQVKKQPEKLSANKKWQFALTALYGRSDIIEKISDVLDENKSYGPQADYLSGNTRNDTANYYLNASKRVKAKAAFSFGIALKKPLSGRSSLITGVEYLQLNTQIETGALKDSSAIFPYNNTGPPTSVNNYYKPGSGNEHINVYRLLQIPLIYEYQLNKSDKLPIHVNAGLLLTQLVSGNALVYDAYHQAYYRNNDLFQKTQVHFLIGANMQFAMTKKTTINIGPQFQYSLSDLLRNNTYGHQHFFSWGLKTTIFFKK
ncbi:MAG TPA: outer membrane beta-barrel protein, partial [Chitinophagaceae bacterium]|nr:outer membrane beta-barrel protein [Chitinophagaceae bacterium]